MMAFNSLKALAAEFEKAGSEAEAVPSLTLIMIPE